MVPQRSSREAGDMYKTVRHLTTLSFKAKKYGGALKEMMSRAMDRVNNRVDIASRLQEHVQPYTELSICS
jgi:serine/threonine protein kinase HipA of HipAB toxin-antitoxin module